MVRTLASHQCGPGSNPGAGMWVEFVVGSLPCCERFFSGYSGFPLSPKTNFPNSNSTRNQVDEEPLSGCATSKPLFIIIHIIKDDNLSVFEPGGSSIWQHLLPRPHTTTNVSFLMFSYPLAILLVEDTLN